MKAVKYLVAVFCFLFVIIFCGTSIYGKIFTLDELPLRFMVAFLGAIVTALITLLLLIRQSAEAELKEKNVKIFEKKSRLFEKFNKKLIRIINNQKLIANDYNDIKSEYYTKLTLYLKEKSQSKINNFLLNLGNCIGISIHDGISDLEIIIKNREEIRKNIYEIINVLAEDLGLAGEIDIPIQKELDIKAFPSLFKELLLDAVNKIFSNEKIFNKAFYGVMANGTFLVLELNGKFTVGGGLHIGPFFNITANEEFPAYNGLYFRFFRPVINPMAELYAVSDGTNYDKNLIDFKDGKNGLIDMQKPLPPQEFILMNIDSIVNNTELPIIRFDDINTIKRYASVYMDIAAVVAYRAFFHYSNAKTKRDNLSIKQLFEKFESITDEQYKEHIIKTMETDFN